LREPPVIRNARRLIASSRVLARAGYLNEWINMDDQDLKLIRQIVASDGRKYTAGNIDRSRYDRLVDMELGLRARK
jgi:hypothetical protein